MRSTPDDNSRRRVKDELKAFDRWASEWATPRKLYSYRTELKVALRDLQGCVVLAGSIDALLQDEHGQFFLFDWKRSVQFGPQEYAHGRTGKGPASGVNATTWHKHSLQLMFYARMLKQTANIDVGDRIYLVRFEKQTYEVVHACTMKYLEHAVDRVISRLVHNEPVVCSDEVGSGDDDDSAAAWGI